MNIHTPMPLQRFRMIRQALPLSLKVIGGILIGLLASCGGDDYQKDFDRDFLVEGLGLDGPLTFAEVAVYSLKDSGGQVVYTANVPGTPIATATTNQSAQIENLQLNDAVNPPYVLEFTSTNATRDLTTGVAPVITTLRTLLTEDMLEAGNPVYATPLTTMAVNIALSSADDSDGQITEEEFNAALVTASSQVKSTLGLGMDASFDLFLTPPVLDGTIDNNDAAALQRVALYRSAIETTRILVQQVSDLVGASGDNVLTALGSDLADDAIDGQVAGSLANIYTDSEEKDDALTLLSQTPSSLCVVEDSEGDCEQTVAQINQLLVDERVSIGVSASTSVEISAPSLETPRLSSDSDGDNVNNDQDAFPDNGNESADADGDGIGNNGDNCPSTSNADQSDSDADGTGDACDSGTVPDPDTDADDDGVLDVDDNCPSLSNADQTDTDADDQGNVCDTDDDNDGLSDTQEASAGTNPLVRDTDGDGDLDNADNCALLANADQANADEDAQGDTCDADDDNDGVADTIDAFPTNPGETEDTDEDGVGNNGDNCPLTENTNQLNADGDLNGDACDQDIDGDGVLNAGDNCSLVANAGQENIDEDAQGDVCDDDMDGDGLANNLEAPAGTSPTNPDSDADEVLDGVDNCPIIGNGDQADADEDDVGDACDDDADNDGLSNEDEDAFGTDRNDSDSDDDEDLDGADNCPLLANPEQLNNDNDAFNPALDSTGGDECDTDDDNDSVPDGDDAFPMDPDESVDADGDLVGDVADNCPATPNADQANNDNDAFNPELDTTGGDACDTDDDNDGLLDVDDPQPFDNDTDNDGVVDGSDNCVAMHNPDQLNTDRLAEEAVPIPPEGDLCDLDDDGDGIDDIVDLCPLVESFGGDVDSDGRGDECDDDADGDGIPNASDDTPFGG